MKKMSWLKVWPSLTESFEHVRDFKFSILRFIIPDSLILGWGRSFVSDSWSVWGWLITVQCESLWLCQKNVTFEQICKKEPEVKMRFWRRKKERFRWKERMSDVRVTSGWRQGDVREISGSCFVPILKEKSPFAHKSRVGKCRMSRKQQLKTEKACFYDFYLTGKTTVFQLAK